MGDQYIVRSPPPHEITQLQSVHGSKYTRIQNEVSVQPKDA
jgi:hypothetical protein